MLKYVWDIPEIWWYISGYVRDRNMSDIYPRYTWDMPDICLRYSLDNPEICLRYPWDMSDIYRDMIEGYKIG